MDPGVHISPCPSQPQMLGSALSRAGTSLGVCYVQKNPILILQDLLADGALGPSMQPRRCSTVTAARHELLLRSARGTPQCQSRANTSQHNRAQQKHRLPARRSLVAAYGDGQPARGCKKTPGAGSPTAGATAIQLPKCPCAGSTSLGCISLGAGSWLGEEERLAGSLRAGGGWQPVLVPGSRAHLRAGCRHPGWEHCKGSQGGGGGS